MPCLTWRHRSIWPRWPRSCSRYSGATPSSGSRGPTAKESTSWREEGWTQRKASGQARAKEATENVAWDGDQPVERGRKKRKTGLWGEVMGQGALRLGTWAGQGRAGQHSWEKQPSGQQREQMEQVSQGRVCCQSSRCRTKSVLKAFMSYYVHVVFSVPHDSPFIFSGESRPQDRNHLCIENQ